LLFSTQRHGDALIFLNTEDTEAFEKNKKENGLRLKKMVKIAFGIKWLAP
jgi:hypothetical protein